MQCFKARHPVIIALCLQVCSSFNASSDSITSRRTLAAGLQLVAYTNCAVNPLIYCLLNERFKARLKRLAATVKLWGSAAVPHGHLRTTRRTRMTVVAGRP